MPEFTGPDWTSRHFDNWQRIFEYLGMIGRPGLRFLEVGCCEGRATLWFLEHVLTDPASRIDVIDTFEGSPEWAELAPGLSDNLSLRRFQENMTGHNVRIHAHVGTSAFILAGMTVAAMTIGDPCFDCIYLDGSHHQADVLTDAVLAWPLLRPGGLLLFDDAQWVQALPDGTVLRPRVGINAFLSAFAGQYDTLIDGTQLGVVKR